MKEKIITIEQTNIEKRQKKITNEYNKRDDNDNNKI